MKILLASNPYSLAVGGQLLVAAVCREALPSFGGDSGAMHARRVRNVPEYFAGSAFDYHHVTGTRNEHAPRGFDSDIVGASIPLDIKLFNLECLRVPDVGRGNAACQENRECGQ